MKYVCPKPGCEAAFARARLLKLHDYKRHQVSTPPNKRAPKKNPFSPTNCPICHATYLDIRQHIKNSHLDKITPGDEADRIIKQPTQQHYVRPAKPLIPCDVCGKVLVGKDALRAHTKAIHERIRHKCPQCDKTYTNIGDMRGHVRAVHEGVTLPCRFCSIIFLRGSQRNQHERQAHADELQKQG